MKNKIVKEILSWLLVIAAAFALAFIVTNYVIIKAEVPSGSMKETIQIDDRLIGFRLAYLFSEPERGDIVIFKYPDNEKENYIKRVIGLPGEKVEIIDGVVYIDGERYEEDYINGTPEDSFGPYEVPEGCYFMLGDNRNSSRDSRKWENTFLKEEDIMAKVLFRYSPSFHWFSDVNYE